MKIRQNGLSTRYVFQYWHDSIFCKDVEVSRYDRLHFKGMEEMAMHICFY